MNQIQLLRLLDGYLKDPDYKGAATHTPHYTFRLRSGQIIRGHRVAVEESLVSVRDGGVPGITYFATDTIESVYYTLLPRV